MKHPKNIRSVPYEGDIETKLQVVLIDGVPTLSPLDDPDFVGRADRIRRLLVNHTASARLIGDELLAVKAALKLSGEKNAFGAWMERHFGWSARHGQRFMKVAEFCQRYPDADTLPSTVICLLASNTTPTEVLSALMVEKQLGARPKRHEVKAFIDAAKSPNRFVAAAMESVPLADQDVIAVAQDTAELILSQLRDRRALRERLVHTNGDALIQALRQQIAELLGEEEDVVAES